MVELNKPNYGGIEPPEYEKRIKSPSQERVLFEQLVGPLVEECLAANLGDEKIKLLALGLGYGYELDHPEIKNNPRIQIIGLDISKEMLNEGMRARLADALNQPFLICADNEKLPLRSEIADCALAVNNMIYKPWYVLRSLHRLLKPGAKCIVNPSIFSEKRRERILKSGCQLRPTRLVIDADGQERYDTDADPIQPHDQAQFTMQVVDHRNYIHEKIRACADQVVFSNRAEAEHMITLAGFEIAAKKVITYQKGQREYKSHFYILRKPD
ncbi:MAG: methyltransferase domain-containing protein [Patescibacteria group bacterium]